MTRDADEDNAELQWPGPVRPWPADFPEVITQTNLPVLYSAARKPGEDAAAKHSEAYLLAKAGDELAARSVVDAVLDTTKSVRIGEQFKGAVVVSVHAEERTGRNKLAVVYAKALAEVALLDIDDTVVQTNRPQHTDANARARFARRPLFSGSVVAGRSYLLVDDVVTSGSSLAGLRHYVEARGGVVVAMTTLAAAEARYGQQPTQLPVTAHTLDAIRAKFPGGTADAIIVEYGVAPSLAHLTESEARVLLGFDSIGAIRSSLLAGRQAVGRRG